MSVQKRAGIKQMWIPIKRISAGQQRAAIRIGVHKDIIFRFQIIRLCFHRKITHVLRPIVDVPKKIPLPRGGSNLTISGPGLTSNCRLKNLARGRCLL